MLRRTLTLLALCAAVAAACASMPPRMRRVRIVHTNDFHGHIERAAAVAAVAAEERAKHPDTLFLDAGDCISGTPVSTVFQGRPIFEVMSAMGYDAVAVGNHEFDHGWKLIEEFREIAGFPLLCANARDPDGKPIGDAPYEIFDVAGVRVGVLGLITKGVPTLTTRKASGGCAFDDPIEVAKKLVPELRAKCDVVIALTHMGVQDDAALAGSVPGIDVVVGGHSHTELKKALRVGSSYVVQAKCYGERVGVIDLVWDSEQKTVAEFAYRLVTIDPETMPNEPRIAELVATWEGQVEDRVAEVIGETAQRLDKKRLRTRIEHIYRDLLDTDFGYQNMGGIRANIETGNISIRDVWTVLPFDNTLVRITLTGEQLPKYSQSRLGDKLDLAATYTIATNSYVADQMEKYFGVTDAPVEDTGLLMRDEVVNWVRDHRGFDAGAAQDARDPDPGEKR